MRARTSITRALLRDVAARTLREPTAAPPVSTHLAVAAIFALALLATYAVDDLAAWARGTATGVETSAPHDCPPPGRGT